MTSTSSRPSGALWTEMQQQYIALRTFLQSSGLDSRDSWLMHPSWFAAAAEIQSFLLGPVPENPLAHRQLQGMMVRQGMTVSQEYEVTHLNRCVSASFAERLSQFSDTDFGSIPFECEALHCSVNTLGHLYYASVALNRCAQADVTPRTIVEFGAGYGNLARVFRHFVDNPAIVLIDLPELIALQYLFVRSCMPDVRVRIEQHASFTPEPGTMHLLPVHFVQDLNISCDLFISTFALSETPQAVQELVLDRAFFDAEVAYVTGQLHGAAPEHGWVTHEVLHRGLSCRFSLADIRPFHVFQNGVQLYEALCSRPKRDHAPVRAPLISIFVPTFNGERYLAATLDSLLAQTFHDFEIVVVDDGSTDGTVRIAEDYARRDSRIRLVRHERNQGLPAARNTGVRSAHAGARYIMNHDSDDISEPQKLEKLVRFLEEHREIAAVGSFCRYFNDQGEDLGSPPLEWEPKRIRATFHEVNSMAVSATLVRRSVFDRIGLFDTKFRVADDYDFWSRCLLGGLELANLPEPLHRIRLHARSLGSSQQQLMEQEAQQTRDRYRREAGLPASPQLAAEQAAAAVTQHLRAAAEALSKQQIQAARGHVERALEIAPGNTEVRALHVRLSELYGG